MTLEQLRIFVAVAEREHVTLGARDLNLTQSATSAAIAALEARHATKLFDRVGRRISLTEAGRVFLGEARAVLARAAAAEAVLADLAELKRGAIVIAASQTVGNYWLPARVARFKTAFPAISVRLTIGNTEEAAALVRDGAADVAIVEGEVVDPSLCIHPLADDELVLVVHPTHPAAKSRSRRLIDPGALRWVVRERGSGTRAIFDEAMRAAGLAPEDMNVSLELPSNEAVRAAAEAGAGAAILSRLVVEGMIEAKRLVRLDFDVPPRKFVTLLHRQRHRTRATLEFLKKLGS